MSYDEADAWEEAGMEAMYEQVTSDPAVKQQFYEQLYDEIVKDFTDNRLRSFYEEKPDVVAPAIDALEQAKKFLPHHDTAAFIFAYIAAEVGLTSALLKPIVHGLVHSGDRRCAYYKTCYQAQRRELHKDLARPARRTRTR